jgi:hypothetical protein
MITAVFLMLLYIILGIDALIGLVVWSGSSGRRTNE